MHIIAQDVKDRKEEKREDYKMLMLASNLEHSKEILKIFDDENDEDRLLTDEELENAQPMSAEEVDAALNQLKTMGFLVEG
jgi:hypothetical protein